MATQAYNEISALRAQNDKELMMFEAEKVELNAQVERERAWLERAQADVLVGNMSQEEEGQLRKKVTKGTWGLGKEKAVTEVAVDKVKMYDDAFAKIQVRPRSLE